jgi:hypothetical protein
MSTEFERLINETGAIRRGRPATLTPEQKAARREEQKRKNRIRNEARRRAHLVLQHRYNDEFRTLMNEELQNLNGSEKYTSTNS